MAITPEQQAYFDECGRIPGSILPTANAEKVRRIVHLVSFLARKPWPELRILDLATGHGTYALECGLQGAREVLGLDARWERMREAARLGRELGLANVDFQAADVRQVNVETVGGWDVVLFLGILYHLDVPDCFHVLENLSEMAPLLLIDTFVGTPKETVLYQGHSYQGMRAREHADADSAATKQAKVRSSIDNCFSFYWAPESLARFLTTIGYPVLLEARAPLEPQKPVDRVTWACLRGPDGPVQIYPWIRPGGGEV